MTYPWGGLSVGIGGAEIMNFLNRISSGNKYMMDDGSSQNSSQNST
jgi:hypothetical protein